jgi:hypothetical protein
MQGVDCGRRRAFLFRLSKETVADERSAQHQSYFSIGAWTLQQDLQPVPDLGSSEACPQAARSAYPAINPALTGGPIPGAIPKVHLRGWLWAKKREQPNLFGGLSTDFMQR